MTSTLRIWLRGVFFRYFLISSSCISLALNRVVMLFDILLATLSFIFFFSERIASVLKSRPLKRRADIRFSFVLV